MALTADQTAALQTAADALAGAAASDVADGLKDVLSAPYQAVYARGFGTHKGEAKTETDSLKAQIEALTQERDDAKAQADTLGSKDADFAAEKKRLEDALVTAKQSAADARTEAAERIKALHSSRETAALVADYIAAGVDPDYAREVLAPKQAGRLRVADPADDGTAAVSYLDADGLTPLQAGRAGLVAATVPTLDAKWITSRADAGGGTQNGGTQNAGGYDPVAAGKAMAAKATAADTSLAFK